MRMVSDVVRILEGLAVEEALIILDNAKSVVESVSGLAVAFECNREMFKTNYPEQVLAASVDFDKESLEAFKDKILGEVGGMKLRETPNGMLFDAMIKLAKEQKTTDSAEPAKADAPIAETQRDTKCIVAPKYGTQEYRDRENYKNSVVVEVCNLLSQRSLSVADGTRVLEVAIAHLVFSPVAPLDRLNDEYKPL